VKNRFLKYAKCLVIIIAAGVVVQKITYKIRDDRVKSIYDDSLYYERVMNAPLRSFHPSVYQDSISRAKQERKMEKLLKEIRK